MYAIKELTESWQWSDTAPPLESPARGTCELPKRWGAGREPNVGIPALGLAPPSDFPYRRFKIIMCMPEGQTEAFQAPSSSGGGARTWFRSEHHEVDDWFSGAMRYLPALIRGAEELTIHREEDAAERFRLLAESWRLERPPTSFASELAMHPAYQQIIGMGEKAVPHILCELEKDPDHWFWALKAITGADPVAPESRGRLPEMVAAWLFWGRARGYRW